MSAVSPEAIDRQRARNRAWIKANPDKANANTKRWQAKNPDKMLAQVARHRGIDPSTVTAKPDVCEVCGSGMKICMDHCHTTSRFRGWICDACNVVLGRVKDNPSLLRALADYLERKAG